ncbi:type I-E CRISPR-associated protein Cse1/CasA [Corynebacterium casei]|uniref:type I-E CRISPR-associated protein Cse1/CasA n=1 Tax=Corynebacterium casei TaxID=160386 RepID=UPI003FCF765C
MANENPSFNLIDEPWISCMDTEGKAHLLSIRQIFEGSPRVLSIIGDSPTQDYSVLRVLLAIFWRAHAHDLHTSLDNRKAKQAFHWDDWFTELRDELVSENRDDVVLGYLEDYWDRFDLVGVEMPFMQVSNLQAMNGESKPIATIIPDSADDLFTMRTASGRESLDYAEAARWLIHAQAFDYSGIKTGAVGDSRVKGGKGYPIGTGWSGMTGGTIVLSEHSLLETLLLNTVLACVLSTQAGKDVLQDKPVWEREPDTSAERAKPEPIGPSDLATWQSRRIRLEFHGDRATAVIISNGDKIPDAGKNVMDDPMTPYRYSPNQSKKDLDAYYPMPYERNRTMWRSLDALIVTSLDGGFTGKHKAPIRPMTLDNLATLASDGYSDDQALDVRIVSMEYGPKSSVYGTFVSSNLGLALSVLKDTESGLAIRTAVRASAKNTGDAVKELGIFSGQLNQAVGGEYNFDASLADGVYAELEPRFSRWLASLEPESIDNQCREWENIVRSTITSAAIELIRGFGPNAYSGREIKQEGSAKGRLVSVGSLQFSLLRKLDKALPLTKKSRPRKQKQEQSSEVSES